jgi:hypothetical protein
VAFLLWAAKGKTDECLMQWFKLGKEGLGGGGGDEDLFKLS